MKFNISKLLLEISSLATTTQGLLSESTTHLNLGRALPEAVIVGEFSNELKVLPSKLSFTNTAVTTNLVTMERVILERLFMLFKAQRVTKSYAQFLQGYLDNTDLSVDFYNKLVISFLVAWASLKSVNGQFCIPRSADVSLNLKDLTQQVNQGRLIAKLLDSSFQPIELLCNTDLGVTLIVGMQSSHIQVFKVSSSEWNRLKQRRKNYA